MEVNKMSFGRYVTSVALVGAGLFGLTSEAEALRGRGTPGKDAAAQEPAKKCVKDCEAQPAAVPTPKKKKFVPKGDCTKLFDGNGRCMSEAEAKVGGYSRLSVGYCPGKDVCYDTTPKPVTEEKKVEAPAEDKFFRIVYQGQCDDEKAELRRLDGVRTAEEAQCQEAGKQLVDYVASVAPVEAKDGQEAVPATLTLEQLLQGNLQVNDGRVNPQKVEEYRTAIQKECAEAQQAVTAVNDYAAFVKEKGCNYQEPAPAPQPELVRTVETPAPVDNFDVTPYLGALVDTDGNFGGEAGVEVLYHLGWVKLGGYADATLQNQSESESHTNDLGIATEDVKTESDLRRYLGGGAAASLSLTDWMEFQLRLGGAWMQSKAQKTITRLGEGGELTSSVHSLAGEAYSGFRFNPAGKFVIDAGARGNTKSEEATFTLDFGYRF